MDDRVHQQIGPELLEEVRKLVERYMMTMLKYDKEYVNNKNNTEKETETVVIFTTMKMLRVKATIRMIITMIIIIIMIS